MADAIRYKDGADQLWTARDRAEFRRQGENDAKYSQNERAVRRREAASATRRRAVRPAQWYTRPVFVQETAWEETAMDVDHAQLPEFEIVYVWTSRDTVTTKRMTAYLAIVEQNVFVDMEELEKYLLSPTNTLRVLSASYLGVRVITKGAEDLQQ